MDKNERDMQNGLRVQNISDLVLREIYGIYKTKSFTKEQIKKYKMTKREVFEKFDNLNEDELNAKNHKEGYAKNDVMTTAIKRWRGKKNQKTKQNEAKEK